MKANNEGQTPTTDFTVQFWGVRGQIATPGREMVQYGGNTSCIELTVADKLLIFDGGTGLRQLGNKLLRQMPVEAYIFFTYCHWDRIQGFPFFIPAFIPGNCFHIYGPEASNGSSFQERLDGQMLGPNFPVPMQVMQSKLDFRHLEVGQPEIIDNITIESYFLNYTHRSIGYRVNYHNHSLVYATDTESDQEQETLDKNLFKLAYQADLLILGTLNTEQHNSKKTSSWENSLAIAQAAGAKKVIFSTHNPDHDDATLRELEAQIQAIFPNSILAREGMNLSITEL